MAGRAPRRPAGCLCKTVEKRESPANHPPHKVLNTIIGGVCKGARDGVHCDFAMRLAAAASLGLGLAANGAPWGLGLAGAGASLGLWLAAIGVSRSRSRGEELRLVYPQTVSTLRICGPVSIWRALQGFGRGTLRNGADAGAPVAEHVAEPETDAGDKSGCCFRLSKYNFISGYKHRDFSCSFSTQTNSMYNVQHFPSVTLC